MEQFFSMKNLSIPWLNDSDDDRSITSSKRTVLRPIAKRRSGRIIVVRELRKQHLLSLLMCESFEPLVVYLLVCIAGFGMGGRGIYTVYIYMYIYPSTSHPGCLSTDSYTKKQNGQNRFAS